MEKHNIPPVYDKNSKIIILGSFPSVKSREEKFFYAHPQNRFWRVLAAVLSENVPQTVSQKKELLLSHGIALWDVIESCEIEGSSDASIKNAVPNDVMKIVNESGASRIFTNGKTAYNLYKKLVYPKTGIEAALLPSTSAANAAMSLEALISEWKKKIKG